MIKSTCRLAITLGLIAASVIWIAHGLNLVPDTGKQQVESRLQLCESLAVSTSWFAQQRSLEGLKAIVDQVGNRNKNVKAIYVVKENKRVVEYARASRTRPFKPLPAPTQPPNSSPDDMSIEILANNQTWGHVRVQFDSLPKSAASVVLIFFCASLFCILSWLFLTRSLKYLNPSKVVPSRVRNAMDVMPAGLVLQDNDGNIVMANEAFAKMVNRTTDQLIGGTPDDFSWIVDKQGGNADDHGQFHYPWNCSAKTSAPHHGTMLALKTKPNHSDRKYIVNSTPIINESGQCRGTLTSFDDVTDLEDKRVELSRTLQVLKSSRDEIRRQNESLHYLASRDSLTGCFNRRSFFKQFDAMWKATDDTSLAVIMMDIDHFKDVNDNYGHQVGDQVIKGIVQIMIQSLDKQGLVCRFGGEEFCIAMPNTDYQTALKMAESIRSAIATTPVENIEVSVSIGVSTREFLAMDVQHMLEQADQSLYLAKQRGRNQVVGWDECSKAAKETKEKVFHEPQHGDSAGFIMPVEHNAVLSALYSALYYRDPATALHCARVANIANALADGFLDEEVVNVLQVAALLHDIGKIGIPDSVLKKPNSLDGHEMAMMHRRESISMSICKSALVSPDVAAIVAAYRTYYNDGRGLQDMEVKQPRLATACRILHIADAFDSMTNETRYRNARTIPQALKELRKCSPSQFVPELVKRLKKLVGERPDCLFPIQVAGAMVDKSLRSDTMDIMAAAKAGDMLPLRQMMTRLKVESLNEDCSLRETIAVLEESLNRNDQELQKLFETTQEMLKLCRENREKREHSDQFEVFDT